MYSFGSSFNVVHRFSLQPFFSGFRERGRKPCSTSAPATSQSWWQLPWPPEGWTSPTWPMSSTTTCLMTWTSMCAGSVSIAAAFPNNFLPVIRLYSNHDTITTRFFVHLASDHKDDYFRVSSQVALAEWEIWGRRQASSTLKEMVMSCPSSWTC